MLQQVRDEAHRFALSYHHQMKQKNDLRSILDDIPDVGEARKKILLKHFGSASKLKKRRLRNCKKCRELVKNWRKKFILI